MTIAIVTNNSNGLYLFRRHLINALIKKGEKVYAITPFDDDVDNLRSLGITMIETDVDRRGTNLVRDLVLLKDYHVILSKIHPDLVITYTIKPNIYAGLTCRQLGILGAKRMETPSSRRSQRLYLRRRDFRIRGIQHHVMS